MINNEKTKQDKVFVLKKKYLIAAAVAVVIIFAVLSIVFNNSSDEISLFYSSARQSALVVTQDGLSDCVLNGKSVSSVSYSFDKSCAAVLMPDGSSYALYCTDGKKCVKITDSGTNNYCISLDSDKVVYVDTSDEMYIYDFDKEKNKTIDTDVSKFCVSPSGNAVVYVKTQDDSQTLCIYTKSKTYTINASYTPLAVSDDLEYIYVLSSDNSLYIIDNNGDIKSKICSAVSDDIFCFSSDMSQVVFSDGTYTYISQNGKSRVRLVPHKATPVDEKNVRISCDSQGITSVYSALTDIFYCSQDDDGTTAVYFIDKNCNRTDIAGNVKKYSFSDNGTLVYLDADGKIYRFKDSKAELIVSGACNVLSDDNGKYIYYTDSALSLYVIKNGVSKLLANGVDTMHITSRDVLLFIMTDGKLYSVSKDNSAQLVDENVHSCVCSASASFYIKNYSSQTGNFELFMSDGSADFEFIDTSISAIV